MDLFDYMREQNKEKESPLASRLRPTKLEEVVGQQHIIGKDKLLYRAIKADKLQSVIFYGPPGTGKTTLAKVIAQTTSAEFMQINATSAGKKDMEAVIEKAKQLQGMYGKRTILFIDEINCVSETLAPAMLQFLQCKTFGNHEIPKGWVIVAAGNPPEYNKSVRDFDVVTLDRVKKITVEPDYRVWKEYAFKENIHPAILSYLELRNNCFYQMETTIDGKQFATPRGWEDLSRIMEVYEKLDKNITADVVGQYIQHERIAKEFAEYYELYQKYQQDYQIAEILKGQPSEAMVKKVSHASFDERVSVVNLLFSGVRQAVRDAVLQEDVLEKVFEVLKSLKEPQEGGNLVQRLGDFVDNLRAERERKQTEGLLERREDRTIRKAVEVLEGYVTLLKKEQTENWEEAFDIVKNAFGEYRASWDAVWDESGSTLEYAFDFMEAAFYNSQEMVIFVSGINTDYSCVRFLETYECERYIRYNRDLLFEDVSQEIRRRIEEL